ncbi:MAG: cyclic peptide export ABC transporter [Gammaproteobacteria bacterium]
MDVFLYLLSRSGPGLILAVMAGIVSGLGGAGLVSLINAALHSSTLVGTETLCAYAGLGVTVVLAQAGSGVAVARLGQAAACELRMELSRRIAAAPLRLLQELGIPRLLANLTEDCATLANAFQVIPMLCINLACVLGCLIYLGWLSPGLLAIVVSMMAFGVVIYRVATLKGMRALRAAREQDDALYSHFRALTEGIKEIKLHRERRDAFFSDILAPTAHASLRTNVSGTTAFLLAASWGSALFYGLIGIILYATPGWEISKQTLTGYTLTILYMMSPLAGVLQGLPALGRAGISLDKIDALRKDLESRKPEGEHAETACRPGPGPLELLAVTHRYHGEETNRSFALGPVSLILHPGELVFVVGGNGSGKTTLALILVGLYLPESGSIRSDGQVIDDTNREGYRQQFSAVFSDVYLFDSLLGLFARDLDDKAHAYLKRLRLDHKVSVVNGALSTLDLSQGQRKRLALLTAYLEDRPFYVFDEWAADQDPLFKDLFYTVLLPELTVRGKTVVVITHDDRYYHLADRYIKLEYGRVVEDRRLRPRVEEERTACVQL